MACRSIEQFSLARSTDDRSVANEAAQYIVVSSRCGANPSSGKNELVVIAYIYRCAAGVCTYRLLFSYISSFAAPSDCVASEQVQSPVSWLAWRAVDSRFARARPPRTLHCAARPATALSPFPLPFALCSRFPELIDDCSRFSLPLRFLSRPKNC